MGRDTATPFGSPDEPLMDRYRRLLGQFIHDFSLLEVVLFRLLCAIAVLEDDIGLALFSGSRADTLMQSIRRCYRARNLPVEPYLETALAQVAIINGMRNIVVHYVTLELEDVEGEVMAFSDLRYPPENAKQVRLSTDALEDMSRDCRMISAVLMIEAEEIKAPGSAGVAGVENRKTPLSWRHKPPSPKTPPRKG